jgi:hypothetical protein
MMVLPAHSPGMQTGGLQAADPSTHVAVGHALCSLALDCWCCVRLCCCICLHALWLLRLLCCCCSCLNLGQAAGAALDGLELVTTRAQGGMTQVNSPLQLNLCVMQTVSGGLQGMFLIEGRSTQELGMTGCVGTGQLPSLLVRCCWQHVHRAAPAAVWSCRSNKQCHGVMFAPALAPSHQACAFCLLLCWPSQAAAVRAR